MTLWYITSTTASKVVKMYIALKYSLSNVFSYSIWWMLKVSWSPWISKSAPLASMGSCARFFGSKLMLFCTMAMPLRSSHLGIIVEPSTRCEPLRPVCADSHWAMVPVCARRAIGAAAAYLCARRAGSGAAVFCLSQEAMASLAFRGRRG